MRAALYIRLSKEDERDGPSQSVVNQRAFLEKYANENDLTVYDAYIDDGWSGCNFDRPAFQRMLSDIEAGKVNMVVTKDLSRLGRDYILTGHYLERYFPEHGVRYVSLLDGIDTLSDPSSNDFTPFRAIMNDMYARDISRKITSVKRDKQRRGLFIGGKPVYGYKMHPTEKNRIIIDETASNTVRHIFSMAISGISCRKIASSLNESGILSPSEYAGGTLTCRWSGERISEMLQNETYIGNMVQGRRVKVSYKSKKSMRVNKDDWIVVTGTHEAIIDRTTFDTVQRILDSRRRTRIRTYDFPLKGLVFCHECGRPLSVINRKRSDGSDTLYFICRTYQRGEKERPCSPHCVKVDTITDVVITNLLGACEAELSFHSLFPTAQRVVQENSINDNDKKDDKHQRINAQIDRLYCDQLRGVLEKEDFERIYRNLCQKRDELREQDALHQEVEIDPAALTEKFLAELAENRELLSQLIERIELTEGNELKIYFRFKKCETS